MKLVVVVLAVFAGAVNCVPVELTTAHYRLTPDHVPSSVCESMTPEHGNSLPSAEVSPYTITATPSTVRTDSGDTVEVKFEGDEFRGLYVQARDVITDEPVGQFLPSDNENVRISSCPGGTNNAASYISRRPISSFSLTWVPPQRSTTVVFKTTIVKTFGQFWVKLPSNEVVVQHVESNA